MQLNGTCLCGDVGFVIRGEPMNSVLCHCINCQKSSGSSFQANLLFRSEQFELLKGHNGISGYRDSNTDAKNTVLRSFCRKCGSNLFSVNLDNPLLKDAIFVMSGCLEERARAQFQPKQEFYCKQRQQWSPVDPRTEKFEGMF
ncbi:uncharacterized protein A1O9_07097 [Exophiala aquamarina CBS 119918]|uniref:CENP-V/GFA domain-containing protein n=1 Tax=Exophiala aquamarina CBS 119918 TaxID=1182545 RepID=A0A072PAX2_9EURO|nr:uncharacterized protein A1O9_07097 [Exophiala aquamarina CBS 119918]KEF56907.1 hypothetical protein A1O9_07097 [Exophiala aquamarina CBS 119918]